MIVVECFFFLNQAVQYFKGKWANQSPVRELRGHTMTFYKICFTALLIGIGY